VAVVTTKSERIKLIVTTNETEMLTGSKAPIACQQVLTVLHNNWTPLNLKKGHIQQHAKRDHSW
jgi:hypothetical protein